MKVNRLIVCLNNNSIYTGFWNVFSPVWYKKFNVIPTMAFVGSQQELDELKFSKDYGDIIRLDPLPEVIMSNELDWSVTWALFFAASKFEEDVCMLQGIDQMPLSNYFFDQIKDVENDKYVIGFADAYTNYNHNTLNYHTASSKMYPSSHHVAKGKNYKQVYNINDSWREEVIKVFSFKNEFHLPSNLWGLDECYSSKIINEYKKTSPSLFHEVNCFWSFWHKNRLDRGHNMDGKNLVWDHQKLKNGGYSELHSPRPFNFYKETILNFIDEYMKLN